MNWRTSSYSANNGACVEVAAWRASSHSGGSNCVEVAAWHTSSHCAGNGACVEVATMDDVKVLVRDTQDRGGTVLALPPDAWRALTARIRAGDGR